MSETEEQLRRILGPEHEPLLDEVLGEAENSAHTWHKMHEIWRDSGLKTERSLAALREAVGGIMPYVRSRVECADHAGELDHEPVLLATPRHNVTVGALRALLAAHDGAPAAQVERRSYSEEEVRAGAREWALANAQDPVPAEREMMRAICGEGLEEDGAPAAPPPERVTKADLQRLEELLERSESRVKRAREIEAELAAPTLTLEEVDGALRKGGVDQATAQSVLGILKAKLRVVSGVRGTVAPC